MPAKVKAMEYLQDLSRSMIRLLPQGIIQLLPVNAVSQVAGLPSDLEPWDQARPLTLTPGPAVALPVSLPSMTQCEVCSNTFVHSKDLQKHMFKHKPVQNTKLKTELNGRRPTAPPTLAAPEKHAIDHHATHRKVGGDQANAVNIGLGSDEPLEHEILQGRKRKFTELAQQDSRSPTTYTTMALGTKTMEDSQTQSSTMARDLSTLPM